MAPRVQLKRTPRSPLSISKVTTIDCISMYSTATNPQKMKLGRLLMNPHSLRRLAALSVSVKSIKSPSTWPNQLINVPSPSSSADRFGGAALGYAVGAPGGIPKGIGGIPIPGRGRPPGGNGGNPGGSMPGGGGGIPGGAGRRPGPPGKPPGRGAPGGPPIGPREEARP